MSSKSNSVKDMDFSKLFTNRLEKRIVDHLETVAGLYDSTESREAMQSQLALVGRSIEGIALMLSEQGYMDNRGRFHPFNPTDLLTIQQALQAALELRNNILLIPSNAVDAAKIMSMTSKTTAPIGGTTDPNTGLNEPPPMTAVDQASSGVSVESPIDDADEIVHPVLLPAITKKL